jgi:hypothetical protein
MVLSPNRRHARLEIQKKRGKEYYLAMNDIFPAFFVCFLLETAGRLQINSLILQGILRRPIRADQQNEAAVAQPADHFPVFPPG